MTQQSSKTPLDLSAHIVSYQTQLSGITGLWGVYIGATFTGAAFSFRDQPLSSAEATLVTVGFLAFAVGHMGMIFLAIQSLRRISCDVTELLNLESEISCHPSSILAPKIIREYRYVPSIAIAALIDFCVVGLIWRENFSPAWSALWD